MEFQRLGNSGLQISRILFGGMSIGTKDWREWVVEDEDEVFALLNKSYEVGIRTYDTANVYSNGASEKLIGKWLKKYNIPRSTVVILSKVYMQCSDPEIENNEINWINRHGLSRKHIMDSVDASVARLGTYIDVYQIHRCDPDTPKEETMEALHDAVKSGKVRYIGASSMKAIEFAQYQFAAERNGWTKFISMQNFYNALYREEEREMIPFCKETGVGIIPWSPLARGVLGRPIGDLTNTFRAQTDPFFGRGGIGRTETDAAIVNRVEEIAKKRGVSMAVVATAWVLAKGFCPIVGFSKPERIDEAVEAVKFAITSEEEEYIDELYQARAVSGHV
jgi:aryl-alcohol dehydrogenase-like predicted oxidoreductase